MEIINSKELKSVIKSVDGYNDYGLDTFTENLTDYCDEITVKDMDDIIMYLEDDLDINTDADLKEIDDSELDDLVDYINNLYN